MHSELLLSNVNSPSCEDCPATISFVALGLVGWLNFSFSLQTLHVVCRLLVLQLDRLKRRPIGSANFQETSTRKKKESTTSLAGLLFYFFLCSFIQELMALFLLRRFRCPPPSAVLYSQMTIHPWWWFGSKSNAIQWAHSLRDGIISYRSTTSKGQTWFANHSTCNVQTAKSTRSALHGWVDVILIYFNYGPPTYFKMSPDFYPFPFRQFVDGLVENHFLANQIQLRWSNWNELISNWYYDLHSIRSLQGQGLSIKQPIKNVWQSQSTIISRLA